MGSVWEFFFVPHRTFQILSLHDGLQDIRRNLQFVRIFTCALFDYLIDCMKLLKIYRPLK